MTDAPETIWAAKSSISQATMWWNDNSAGGVEYTRADVAQAKIAELENALAAASGTIAAMRADAAKGQARIAGLEAALEWYASHVADCRKQGRDGDVARAKLDRDGGSKARVVLRVTP
jgi:hypothetical protein